MTQAIVTYTRTAIALHWATALLIAAGVGIGVYMVDLSLSPTKLKLYSWHKWIGVTVWLLTLARLAWRWRHPAPPLPQAVPAWQRRVAEYSHWLLYGLLLAVPLSGWLMSSALGFQTVYFGVLPIPDLLARDEPLGDLLKALHYALNTLLLGLVAAHAAAALKHHFIDRDTVLRRMLSWSKP